MREMEQQSTSNPPVMQRQHTGIVKDTREGMGEITMAAHIQQGRRPDLRLWSNGEMARTKNA